MNLIEAYISKLKSHDWEFEFADDSKTWRAGQHSFKVLRLTQKCLDPTGEIWNQHAPAHHHITPPTPKGSS